MASVNKAIIVGNLGRDPETRYAPSGDAICNISVATTDQWKDKSGEKQERTEWHRIVFFGKLAEIAGQYLAKGSSVYIEGTIRTRKYEKDGIERYSTEIIADKMQMLGGKQDGERQAQSRDTSDYMSRQENGDTEKVRRQAGRNQNADPFDGFDSNIPF